jgi:hypothetical protein
MAGSFCEAARGKGYAMRTNWPAYVAAEMNRIVADEEACERLVDLFKQAHGRAPSSDCEAYQWGAKREMPR